MTTLTKLQLALLIGARDRPDGSMLPPPEALTVAPNRVRKAAGQLIALAYAAERQVAERPASWRADGEAMLGAFITDAGRTAILPTQEEQPSPTRETKVNLVLAMLSAADGASLEELVAATGWLPHTTRAALTGLKKKDHAVVRIGDRGASRYRIAEDS